MNGLLHIYMANFVKRFIPNGFHIYIAKSVRKMILNGIFRVYIANPVKRYILYGKSSRELDISWSLSC